VYIRVLCVCVLLDVYYCFLAYYKRCDGIILPEHTDSKYRVKAKGYFSTSANTCNGVKLSSFKYDTKDLSLNNHIELRKNALLMHLEGMHNILSGKAVMEDVVNCIGSVCATFLSLHKNYLCYKTNSYSSQLKDNQWTFTDTEVVGICVVCTLHCSRLYKNYFVYVHTHILILRCYSGGSCSSSPFITCTIFVWADQRLHECRNLYMALL